MISIPWAIADIKNARGGGYCFGPSSAVDLKKRRERRLWHKSFVASILSHSEQFSIVSGPMILRGTCTIEFLYFFKHTRNSIFLSEPRCLSLEVVSFE